jgi:hypothetical protein
MLIKINLKSSIWTIIDFGGPRDHNAGAIGHDDLKSDDFGCRPQSA